MYTPALTPATPAPSKRPSTSIMVDVSGIEKSYGATQVLDGITLQIATGTAFALLGPNGAGKTTLIRILATLVRPDAGTALINRHDLRTERAAVQSSFSLTGQHAAVDEMLTGRENLLMMGRLRRLGRRDARRRADELLAQFDLVDAAHRTAKTYSGGMRRKLDLAISLITRPPLIFLDEPTVGLDPRSREALQLAVLDLIAAGVTILLTTQYLDEADRLASRIALLDGGRIIADGTPDQLKASISGEVAALEFADDTAFRRAVAGLSALRPGDLTTDPACRIIEVSTDGSAESVRVLLNLLDREGAQVQRVSLHRPSLDDVFLSLTQRKPTQQETSQKESVR